MAYMRSPHYVYVSRGHGGQEVLNIDIGVQMDMEVFDELVVMRLAEMSQDEVEEAARRAVRNQAGNCGCDALSRRAGRPGFIQLLEESLAQVRAE